MKGLGQNPRSPETPETLQLTNTSRAGLDILEVFGGTRPQTSGGAILDSKNPYKLTCQFGFELCCFDYEAKPPINVAD